MLGEKDNTKAQIEKLWVVINEQAKEIRELKAWCKKLDDSYHKQQNHIIKQEQELCNSRGAGQQKINAQAELSIPTYTKQTSMPSMTINAMEVKSEFKSCRRNTGQPFSEIQPVAVGRTAMTNKADTLKQASTFSSNDFVVAYNELPSSSNMMNRRIAKNEFIQKFSVRGFSCVNSEARIANPSVASIYIADKVSNAEYWAMAIGKNHYAVVPNVKLTYDGAHHVAAGMQDVFTSNFKSGNIYYQIKVKQPACFLASGDSWILRKKGELLLKP